LVNVDGSVWAGRSYLTSSSVHALWQELNVMDLDGDLSVWRMKVLAFESLHLHGSHGPGQHGMASRVFL